MRVEWKVMSVASPIDGSCDVPELLISSLAFFVSLPLKIAVTKGCIASYEMKTWSEFVSMECAITEFLTAKVILTTIAYKLTTFVEPRITIVTHASL